MIEIPSSSTSEDAPPRKIASFPNLESKLLDYCKKAKKETEENFKFLLLKNKSYEESVKQNIETCYDHIVKLYIETILKNDLSSPNLFDNWYEKTVDLVKQAIAKVSPSYRDLGDSSNINEFIKVKTIKYKNQSLCKLIDGFAFRKNVSSKKMRFSIDNPKLLLLNCGLDVNENDQASTATQSQSQAQAHSNSNTRHEKEFTELIQKKFESIGVDIVLLNQNVSHYIQKELMDKNNITLVLNVKSKSLKNIARCTKTSLFNSVHVVDNSCTLGQCKKFRIEKYKSFSSSLNNINAHIKANEYNLMIFEGCDNLLFQTMVISGPNETELKKLKELLKYSILLTVRDFYLQKHLLYFLYCDIPKRISNLNKRKVLTVASIAGFNKENSSNNGGNIEESPSRKEGLLARKKSASVSGEDLVYKYGFDTQVLFEKFSEINFVKLTMCRGIKKQFNINPIVSDNRTTMGAPGSLIDTNKKHQHNSINHDNMMESTTLLMPPSPVLHNKHSYVYDNIAFTPELYVDITRKPSSPSIPNFELLTSSPIYSYLSTQIPNTSETELLKNLNIACGEPEDIKLIHYSLEDKYDKPLGKLIIELCYERDQKCEKCKRVKSLHFYYLYSVNSYSRIKIAFILDNSQFKLDKIYEYINREGSVDFRKYSNIPTTTTISQTNLFAALSHNIDYSLDIFSYGYCRTCNEIVTPLCKLPREVFNYSSSKFLKHMLLNHDIKNRSDNMNFNLSNFFAKNTCSHSSFKCLDRIFVTKIGALSFSYENIIKYFIEPRFLMLNDSGKSDIANSCETFVTNYQTKCIEVLDAINANIIYANDELIAIKRVIADKKAAISANSLNYFASVVDKVEKEINRFVALLPEQKKNLVSCVFAHKYDRLNKCVFYVKKLLFRITQVKIIHNNIRKTITKIKQCIMLDLYYNVGDGDTSKTTNGGTSNTNNNEANQPNTNANINANNNNNVTNNNVSSNLIGRVSNTNNNNGNDLIINEINAKFSKMFPTVNYISIESKQSYIDIIKSLNYYDEKHLSCICEAIQETDISSIIAYTLTSDQYRNHVNQSGKHPLLDIICERYNNNTANISNTNNNSHFNTAKQSLSTIGFGCLTQDNFFLSNTNNNAHINTNNNALSSKLQSDFIEMNTFLNFNSNNTHFNESIFEMNNSHLHNTTSNNTKCGYSYNSFSNNQNSQILYDTMLLFDSSKNIYRDKDTHKTNKELEMELISDDKSHFVYSMSSLNNKTFKLGTLSRKVTISSRQGLSSTSSRHEKTPYDTLDEKLNAFEEDIQKALDNLVLINSDMKELKNSNVHIQRHYSHIQKLHFVEDTFHSSQIDVVVYFPKQFEALRLTYFCSFDELIYSLTRFTKWKSNSGGKSKALFYKSKDNKLLFKSVSKQEFKMFIDTAGQYFHHNARYLFHKMPSALAKVLGQTAL